MDLVIVESPYAGSIESNLRYARAAVRHSLSLGESPIASHLLYTQDGILRDEVSAERAMGIAAGLAWLRVVDTQAFYVDRGWSRGMIAALVAGYREGRHCGRFEIRSIRDKKPRGTTPEERAAAGVEECLYCEGRGGKCEDCYGSGVRL